MKILHVITTLSTGGAEHLMVDLVPRLRDAGHEVELCVFNGGRTPFRDELERAGITIHALQAGGNVYNPLNIVRLWRLMRAGKYDIVHTHNTACQLFAAIASLMCNTTLVTTEHSTSNRRRKMSWYKPIDRWMFGRYSKIICISEIAEKSLREYLSLPSDTITTINNGVDVARFAAAKPNEDLAAQWQDKHLGMMVAGFRWEKDHTTIIKAYSLLPDRYHLALVGDGAKRPEMEQLAKDLGVAHRVHFLGLRSDIPQLLATADVRIMSSHFEGLSLSSVEGMAAGVLIASDVDGLREVVQGAGVLFGHGDAQGFADAILRLDSDAAYREAVASACRERARGYDIGVMAQGYLQEYEKLRK